MQKPIKEQLEVQIKKKNYKVAEQLAKSSDNMDLLINMLSTNKDALQASKIIKKNKLKLENYPKLIQRFQKKYIRYLLKESPYLQAELFLESQKELLAILAEDLFFFKEKNLALSIIKRHKLEDLINKKEVIDDLGKDFDYKENIYLKDEFFGATELLDKNCQEEFIHFSDFGMREENICLVDNEQTFELFIGEIKKKPKYVFLKDLL